MTPRSFLLELGLTPRQAEIYIDLAVHPQSSVMEIFKRTDIPRSSIYLELEELTNKGFVADSKIGKKTVFSITNPSNITNRIAAEKERFNILSQNASTVIKQLTDMAEESSRKSADAIIYRGQEGIKQQLWNILHCKSGLVVGFSPNTLENVTDRKFAEKWRQEFKERGLRNKMILNVPKSKEWSDVAGFLEEHVQVRAIEGGKIAFVHEVFLYDNTLSIISPKEWPNQYGIEIKDELLTKSYMAIFDYLWDIAGKQSKA